MAAEEEPEAGGEGSAGRSVQNTRAQDEGERQRLVGRAQKDLEKPGSGSGGRA